MSLPDCVCLCLHESEGGKEETARGSGRQHTVPPATDAWVDQMSESGASSQARITEFS